MTLGALAELESRYEVGDMLGVANRFSEGRISAGDAMNIIAAGLRGAGEEISDEEVAGLCTVGGASGYVDIVARLLVATFGDDPS